MQIIWKEARPQRGWPKRGGEWPTDAEYVALRHAKSLWDTSGPNQSWCACAAGCNHGDKSWAVFFVARELDEEGHPKWVAVRAARNRYGYESLIYCDCGQIRKTEIRMRWDGVPLMTGEQAVKVLHGTVVHHHHAAPEHVHHNFRSTW